MARGRFTRTRTLKDGEVRCVRCDNYFPDFLAVFVTVEGCKWYLCLDCNEMVIEAYIRREYKDAVNALKHRTKEVSNNG